MQSSPDLARSARKLEDLPSDGGQAVDTLAGALLRVFLRLNEQEAAIARLTRRVAQLERSGAEVGPVNGAAATAPGAPSALNGAAGDRRRPGAFPPGEPAPGRRAR